MDKIEKLLNDIILLNIRMKLSHIDSSNMSDVEFKQLSNDIYDNTYNKQYDILVEQYNLDINKELSNKEINDIISDLETLYSKINAQVKRKINITRK